jgi:histidinol-phosphate aminotransferase
MLLQLHRLNEALKKQTYVQKVYPTDANFVLVKVNDPNHLYQYLVERKVVVRNRNTTPKCEGCLRISVVTIEETDLLIKYIDQYPSTVI